MKTTLIVILTLLSQLTWGQTNSYKGMCCDDNGKPTNPTDPSINVYSIKKHKTKTPLELHIKSVKLGDESISIDVSYNGSIDYETPVIKINDTVAIKLVLGKTVEYDMNKYLYKLLVYKRDTESNCWRPLSTFNSFYDVYDQTMSLNLFAIGYENSADYFQIQEGWIKLD